MAEKTKAIQQIEKLLTDAFAEVGPRIRQELLTAYRGEADLDFKYLLEAAQDVVRRPDRKRIEYARYYSYDKDAAFDEWRKGLGGREPASEDYKTIPPDHMINWGDIRRWARFLRVDYREADQRAKDSYEGARDSFVAKNLFKIGTVLEGRTDLVDASTSFRYRRGVFVGTLSVKLSDASFTASLSLKYVIRTIPRVTPYYQYPLLFTGAVVRGREYGNPSEEELRVLLGGKPRAALEAQKAAQIAAEGWCKMSGKHLPESLAKGVGRVMSPYVTCPACGATVSAQHYKFRKHKTPEAEEAERARKLVAAGYCPKSKERMGAELFAALKTKYPTHIPYDVKVTCEHCGAVVKTDASERRAIYQKHKPPKKR